MSRATRCLKCLVILCNCLLAAIGLVMLGGGIFLMVGSQQYLDQYTREFVVSVGKQSGNGTKLMMNDEESKPDFSTYIAPFGIVLIVFGVFITLFGLAGIFGVWCSSRILLVIFDAGIRRRANYTLTERYVGLMDRGQDSLAWNYVMIKLQCCGLDNYKDFNYAKKWLRNETRGDPLMNSTKVTPLACCKEAENIKTSDFTCSTNPTDQTSNWQTGCWDAVEKSLLPYRTVTIAIISAVLVAQALLALMAFLIAWRLPSNWKNF